MDKDTLDLIKDKLQYIYNKIWAKIDSSSDIDEEDLITMSNTLEDIGILLDIELEDN